ncbi:MAG: hypothetical protein ACI4JF_09255 [Oscillospiraceae bacterium]
MAENKSVRFGQKLRGAVLIMVVTVMFMLIILLLATLTVVSTAQNRAYMKYEENQAYYTARSALEFYTQTLLTDSHYIARDSSGAVINYSYTENGTTKTVPAKQGLVMELELYKIRSQEGAAYEAANPTYKAYWSDPIAGDGTFPLGSAEESNYTIKYDASSTTKYLDYIEYEIEFPDRVSGVNSSGDNKDYGLFVDTDSTTGKQKAKIKVEVLSRTFDNNQGYTYADIVAAVDETTTPKKSEVQDAIAKGTRSKDNMALKITSTVEYMGVEGQAVLVYNTSDPLENDSGNAMTSFGTIELNNLHIVGGATSGDNNAPGNTGSVYSDLFVGGGYYAQGGGTSVYLTSGDSFYIGGDMAWQNNPQIQALGVQTGEDAPLVYVEGNFGGKYSMTVTDYQGNISSYSGSSSSGCTWAGGSGETNPTKKVDLVCHEFGSYDSTTGTKYQITNGMSFNGNIYCVGNFVESTTDSNFNGDIFVGGNLHVEDGKLKSGRFFVKGVAIVPDSWVSADNKLNPTLGGSSVQIYAAGGVYKQSNLTDAVVQDVSLTYSYDFTDLEVKQNADYDTTEDVIEIYLPVVSGSISAGFNVGKGSGPTLQKRQIPTELSQYARYYHRETDGTLSKNVLDQYYPITAKQYAGTPDASDRAKGNYVEKDFSIPADAKQLSASGNNEQPRNEKGELITQDEEGNYIQPKRACLKINGVPTFGYELNNPGNYQLMPSSSIDSGFGTESNPMIISGVGEYNFYVEPGQSYYGIIVVEDGARVNFYSEAKTGVYVGQNTVYWRVALYTREMYDKMKSNQPWNFGSTSAYSMAAPQVNYFLEGELTWDISEAGRSLMTGYTYAPYATIKGCEGTPSAVKFSYNGVSKKPDGSEMSARFEFVGSVVAANIHMSSTGGVGYINPDFDGTEPGEPIFTWKNGVASAK